MECPRKDCKEEIDVVDGKILVCTRCSWTLELPSPLVGLHVGEDEEKTDDQQEELDLSEEVLEQLSDVARSTQRLSHVLMFVAGLLALLCFLLVSYDG